MTPVAETLFVDTNVLLSATDESRACHRLARALIGQGGASGIHGATSGQILREYLVVATRPVGENGLGMSSVDALSNIEQFARRLALCDETESVSKRLRSLVRTHGLTGKSIHDANVVATMAAHGIRNLVTENPGDFDRYPEVMALELAGVSGIGDQSGET